MSTASSSSSDQNQLDTSRPLGVLFVCLGNICRSPLAEVIFARHAADAGLLDKLHLDSCGTGGWHAGNSADPRSIAIAALNGLEITHRARQWRGNDDVQRFEFLIAMDRSNHRNLLATGAPPERVRLMRSFDPAFAPRQPGLIAGHNDGPDLDVPDPYHGGPDGFEKVYRMLDAACAGLLQHVRTHPSVTGIKLR